MTYNLAQSTCEYNLPSYDQEQRRMNVIVYFICPLDYVHLIPSISRWCRDCYISDLL